MAESYFNRVCRVTVGERVIEYDPAKKLTMSIEFEHRQVLEKFNTTTMRIYNPASATVKAFEPTKDKATGEEIRADITIEAGYQDALREVITGQVTEFTVSKEGNDRVLEAELSDNFRFVGSTVGKSLKKVKASAVLRALGGVNIKYIEVGEDKYYERLTIIGASEMVRKLARATKSTFYFRNGRLRVLPNTLLPGTVDWSVDFDTGLIKSPKRFGRDETSKKRQPEKGYLLNTLFAPNKGVGDTVSFPTLDGGTTSGVIIEAQKSFSTFGDAGAEFRVKEAA